MELIAFGLPLAEVARRVGCARGTLHAWLTSGEFQAEVAARTAELRDEFRARVHELGLEAVDALKAALRGDGTAPQVRAAMAVLQAIGALDPKTAVETKDRVEVGFPMPDWMHAKATPDEG